MTRSIGNSIRIRFYHWIIKNIAKTPEGEMLPYWVTWLWKLIFPIKAIYYRIEKSEGYQLRTNTWKIRGHEFSSPFFDHLVCGNDDKFKIISRENGIITIEKFPND